jgi:uncharacterized protein
MSSAETTAKGNGGSAAPAEPRLLQMRFDRRLGHEWDDWDGQPLPDDGSFHTRPGIFLRLLLLTGAVVAAAIGFVLWLVAPRLATLWTPLPLVLGGLIALALLAFVAWTGLVGLSLRKRRALLPGSLAEAGPVPYAMPLVERVGSVLGISRDRVGNAAMQVFNGLASARRRPGVAPDDLLVLLPRCLGKDAMQGAMDVSARYGVPMFVAARGMYARAMIRERRPKRIVAVACERDLVSGVHDVGSKLPVLGTVLTLPDGPCKNTEVDLAGLERNVRTFLGLDDEPGTA